MRDYDGYVYLREWSGSLLLGGFEPRAKPVFTNSAVPSDFQFQLLPEDWDQFRTSLLCKQCGTSSVRHYSVNNVGPVPYVITR